MADKTPVRVVYNASSVATGLAEFQSTETVGYAFGGTGLSALGSAGQVLKVNAAGTAMEFGAEGDISITNLVAPSNSDLTLTTSGTGNIVLDSITVRGTTLSSADSSAININEVLIVDGTASVSGALSSATRLALATGATVTGILDEDAMGTDSATQLATQQSIKAYADTKAVLSGSTNNTIATVTGAHALVGESNLTFDGTTLTVTGNLTVTGTNTALETTTLVVEDPILELAKNNSGGIANSMDQGLFFNRGSLSNVSFVWDESADEFVLAVTAGEDGTTSGNVTIDSYAGLQVGVLKGTTGTFSTSLALASGATVTGILDEDAMGTNSATQLATQQSIKAYVDAVTTSLNAQDLDFQGDSGGALNIDLDTETLDIAGGTGIDTSGSSNTLTVAIDSTVTTLTGTQTLTNKTLTAPTITATSTTVGGKIKFLEGTDNGTNAVTLVGAASTADVDLILPAAADTLVGKATTDTLTNKSIDLGNNTLTGSLAEFNSALQSESFASLTGSETLTNKTLTSPVINGPTGDWVKIAGTNFTGSLIIGHATTGTLDAAEKNTSVGLTALDAITTGDNNSALGHGALTTLTTGGQNTAVGMNASKLLLDSTENTAVGYNALRTTSTGDNNTAVGSNALYTNSGGHNNTGIGRDSLKLTTGSYNIGLGWRTGDNITSGDGNVIIGTVDAASATGDRQLMIAGYDGSTTTTWIKGTNTGAITFNSAYTFPTADGDDGQALVTDGSGTLTFGTVGSASASDDSLGIAISDKKITSTARTIDSFHSTFQDSVLYYVVSNDHYEDCVNIQKVSVAHNNTTAYCTSSGAQSKASTTMTAFTCDLSNDMVRLKAASSNAIGGSLSFYKFGLGDNSSAATSGNVIVTINADVDSASESLVSFAHGTYRGAKLFISVNNDAKTEVGNIEALVVHDGTTAYISTFGEINSGNNSLLTLTAAISGINVVVSASGGEANLRVTVHAIMLKDTMVTDDGTYSNTEAIAPVTISSTATEVDTLVEGSNNGAVYYFVSKNASEGHYAVNEVFMAMGSGEITVASGSFISTKGTNQLAFTSDYKDDVENTGQLLCTSTSGGSTTVSAYRINCLAK